MSEPYGSPWSDLPRQPEPEPRMAGPDEGPIGGGSWQAHCASCCRLTTHRAFTDEHGCELGGGCDVCRWIWTPRECVYVRAKVITLEQFKASLPGAVIQEREQCPEPQTCVKASSSKKRTLAPVR